MKSRFGWAIVGKNKRITKLAPDDSGLRTLQYPGELCIYAKKAEAIEMACDDEYVVKVFIKEVW